MSKKHSILDLNGQWTMEGKTFTDGLTHKAYRSNYVPTEPVPVQIPGVVQSALVEAGICEDPYFEDNYFDMRWIEDKEWWFFKKFTAPKHIEGNNYILALEGITYRAEVWLNGVYVDRLEGMFKRWFLDITDLIHLGEENVLTLRIRAHELSSQDHPGSWAGRRVIMSTAVAAPFSFYWNWSPHLVPIGIWKPISLKVVGEAQLKDPFVRSEIKWVGDNQAESAKISTTVEVVSFVKKNKNAIIKGVIQGLDFDSEAIEFEKKVVLEPDKTVEVDLEAVVESPELWWPNGMGEHPLYEMTLTIEDDKGNAQDEINTEFGIRELNMIPNDDDKWVQDICGHTNRPWSIVGDPYPWTFVCNKRRFFVRGTNWLPVDSLFRFTEEKYRPFLEQAEAANVNMMRVWGGGVHETETFYKMCNRNGIMTWTEFWLACSSYPAMPHDLFIDNAIDMIKVLRNHPSLPMWSGGNEYNPDEPENKRLVDKLQKACDDHDPTRWFHRGSPYRGDRHGGLVKLPTRTTNKYSDLLLGDTRLTLFRSEIAVTRSAPTIENIKKFLGEDKIWPIDKKLFEIHHAKYSEMERDAKEYGGTDNLQHWLMSGHLAHGQNHRHNMEYCRQNKWHTTGCMQWQLNSSWPTFHRELIDYYGAPKPAFFAYKRSMDDHLVVADTEKYVYDGNETFTAKIYAISEDLITHDNVNVKAVIYDRNMKAVYTKEGKVTLSGDVSVPVCDVDWKVPADYLKKVFFLHLEVKSSSGISNDNLYWFGTSDYSRPSELIELSGSDWIVRYGTEKEKTDWEQAKVPGRPYRINQQDEAAFLVSGNLVEVAEATGPDFAVYYKKKFRVPAEWKDTKLEFFCAGLESNDEVYINGKRIGGTEDKNNIMFHSDPLNTPNLTKVFYTIPDRLLRWGSQTIVQENEIEIKLYGDNVTGISEAVFIRKESTDDQKEAIIEFDNEGAYIGDLRNLPEAELDIKVSSQSMSIAQGETGELEITVKNTGNNMSFLTGLRIKGNDDAFGELYSDNYFHLLPKEKKKVTVKFVNNRGFVGSKNLQLDVEGWNTKSRTLDEVIEVKSK